MARRRLSDLGDRIRSGFADALAAEHTPGEIAASFALGTFVTALPTAGTGLILFVALAYRFERVSKLALFAPGLVLNPLVKGGVYTAGFLLGSHLLGPVSGVRPADLSLAAGPPVLVRWVLGTALIAGGLAAVGYVAVGGGVRLAREHDLRLRRLADIDPR